ncbi:MAG: lysylphosphatidylglycerol synthase transmembrane domain-containing protein [Capsulimonas sp.]|uniref:lysylphosphatidylglycerol synthase transmembrane domain-containing protein n=1 Tax=Capsulimonas sp. TaxID=2494211 RepID=UPI00326526D4
MNHPGGDASAPTPNRTPWARILIGSLVLAAIGAALAPTFQEAGALRGSLAHLDWRWVLAAILCQVGVYCCVAAILGVAIRACEERAGFAYLVFVAFAFMFANRCLPGPAVAGLATLVVLLRRRSVSAGAAQTAAAGFYVADYASFFALALAALLSLVHSGDAAELHPRVLLPAILIIAIGAAFALAALRSQERLERLAERWTLRTMTLLRRPNPQAMAQSAGASVSGFHTRWTAMTARPGPLAASCAVALLMHVAEVGTLLCAARAFHFTLAPAAATAGYVGGNLAAIVSLLPGGLGFFEGAMTVTFHRLGGMRPADALGVTLLYRLLSVWLPIPVLLGVVREALRTNISQQNPDSRKSAEVQ